MFGEAGKGLLGIQDVAFRARSADDPDRWASADDPAGLERARANADGGEPVDAFGALDVVFDEDDGTVTLLFRSGDRDRAFRVRMEGADFDAVDGGLALRTRMDGYRQNYLYARGALTESERGFEMWLSEPGSLRLGGDEPAGAGQ